MTAKNRVIHLHQRDPQLALAGLNRITGLRFARWPESLLAHAAPSSRAVGEIAVVQVVARPEVSTR